MLSSRMFPARKNRVQTTQKPWHERATMIRFDGKPVNLAFHLKFWTLQTSPPGLLAKPQATRSCSGLLMLM